MVIADLDYTEYFTEEEIQEYRKIFDKYDEDKSDSIDVSELGKIFESQGMIIPRQQIEAVVNEIDVDHTGCIEFEEFLVMNIKMSGKRPRANLIDYHDYLDPKTIKQLLDTFVKFDTTGNESMDKYELVRLFRALGVNIQDSFVDSIMTEVDRDESGQIEFDEFCTMWAILNKKKRIVNNREFLTAFQIERYKEMFILFDPNCDNMVDKDELDLLFRKLGLVMKKEQVEGLLKEYDSDGSGMLDFQEFCAMMVKLRGEKRKRNINPKSFTVNQLLEEGFSIQELKNSRFTLKDMKGHIQAKKLVSDGDYEVVEFRQAGFNIVQMKKAGIGAHELRRCGYSMVDLRNAGFGHTCVSNVNKHIHHALINDNFVLAQRHPHKEVEFPKNHSSITPRIRHHCDFVPRTSNPVQNVGMNILMAQKFKRRLSNARIPPSVPVEYKKIKIQI